MSFWVSGAILTTATTVGTHIMARNEQRSAARDAKKDAAKADKQARKAEVFAETEGDGIGQLGQVSLEVDDDELEDGTVSSTLRI